MDQNILAMISDTWQMVTIIAAALGVGYAMARRLEGLLGKDKKGNTLLERIERIELQVHPNGGSSMSDKSDNPDLSELESESSNRLFSGSCLTG